MNVSTMSPTRMPLPPVPTPVPTPYDTRAPEVLARLIKPKDICLLTRQLATLLQAGMALVPALAALVEQLRHSSTRHQQLALALEHIHNQVTTGTSLSDALNTYPAVFSPLYVSLVAAGENSGTLEQILERLADSLEKRLALTGKIKAALAYPVMMAIVAVGVVVFLLSHVVPSITEIFQEMQRSLPLPTRLLITISEWTRTHLGLMAVVLVATIGGILWARRSPQGRLLWDQTQLRLPWVRDLWLYIEMSRVARTLGTLLIGGVPILRAMDVTGNVIQNHALRQTWQTIRDRVQKGQGLAEAMQSTNVFPPVFCHVIATGQNTGTLETGLLNIADMVDTDLESRLKAATALLEPLILLIMGGIVGFVVMAILLPIFDINQAL